MLYRSLAVAALLSVAQVGVASAQSIYVAPGGVANIYVAPNGPYDPYGGAPAQVLGPGYYDGGGYYNGGYGAAVAVPPAYGVPNGYPPAPVYDEPLSAYGAAPGVYMQRRIYVTPDAPRPPLPIPLLGRFLR
jgi:hypothetical protein